MFRDRLAETDEGQMVVEFMVSGYISISLQKI